MDIQITSYTTSLYMQVARLRDLIMTSQSLMREYAFRQLCSGGLDEDQAKISSCSCVSQRDIQRVFIFYSWVRASYTKYQPYKKQPDYCRRAMFVALGIVYYMRLNSNYRKEYEECLDKQGQLPNEVTFSQVGVQSGMILFLYMYEHNHTPRCS